MGGIMLLIVISFGIGAIFGLFCMSIVSTPETTPNPKYKSYKGEMFEVLETDVLNESNNLEHLVVYRALWGRHNLFALPKNTFFGTVINNKNIEVKRFEKVN